MENKKQGVFQGLNSGYHSGFYEGKTAKNEDLLRYLQGDLNCEEAIMKDKERFGRVRKSMMMHLREEYGKQVADRALWRVNRRRTEGYFKNT